MQSQLAETTNCLPSMSEISVDLGSGHGQRHKYMVTINASLAAVFGSAYKTSGSTMHISKLMDLALNPSSIILLGWKIDASVVLCKV